MKPYEYGDTIDAGVIQTARQHVRGKKLDEAALTEALIALGSEEIHETPRGPLTREDMPGIAMELLDGDCTKEEVRWALGRIGVPEPALNLETRAKIAQSHRLR